MACRPLLIEFSIPILRRQAKDKIQGDLDDGVKDGVISNPRACAFEPAEVLCNGRKESQCLTAKQIEAVKKGYAVRPPRPGSLSFPSEAH